MATRSASFRIFGFSSLSVFPADIVSKVRDYQHRASECVRLALAARDQTNKLLLLDMAQCWLTLSEQALAEENNAVNAESTESQ